MNELLDLGFSMFNNHINNGGERAKKAFIKRFGKAVWEKQIQPYSDKGIMSIFDKKPNQYTAWYVEMVAAFVNEKHKMPTDDFVAPPLGVVKIKVQTSNEKAA